MKAQTLGRVVLGGFMVTAGVLHLTTQREEFRAQVPDWFPVDEDLTVLASGVVEVALGGAFVALPRHRRTVGALLAAFFVAIFPGNIAQYVEGTPAFGLDTDRARLTRLFFQPVLVLWALWAGGLLAPSPPGPRRGAAARGGRDGRVVPPSGFGHRHPGEVGVQREGDSMPITVPTRSTSRTLVGVAGLCVLALAATTAPVTMATASQDDRRPVDLLSPAPAARATARRRGR